MEIRRDGSGLTEDGRVISTDLGEIETAFIERIEKEKVPLIINEIKTEKGRQTLSLRLKSNA